jgi:hypothetical protein
LPVQGIAEWGWRLKAIGHDPYERSDWQFQGDRVGWVEGDTVYLDPEASYRSAQTMVASSADGLGITAQTLRKRLHERGLLVKDDSRETLTVRRVLEGRTRNVLQLVAGVMVPQKLDIPDIPDSAAEASGAECRECQVSPGVDPQDRQAAIDERAAIMEADRNMPRQQAQAEARRLAREQ